MRHLRIGAIAIVTGLAISGTSPLLAANGAMTSTALSRIEMTDDGPVLVTLTGMTLYTSANDDGRPGQSLCSNVPVRALDDVVGGLGVIPIPRASEAKSCVDKSPPYMADAQAKADGDWSTIERRDGGRQWAYQGHPLYTSIKDHKPGDRNGTFAGGYSGGLRIARAMDTLKFPSDFDLTTVGEDLVLQTKKTRQLVYTPKGRHAPTCGRDCGDQLQPIEAPAVANLQSDWTIVELEPGQRQYAYRGKPLYTANAGISSGDIEDAGGWEPVVFRKGTSTPRQIGKQFSLLGQIYTDQTGRTLYSFHCTVISGALAVGGVNCDDPGDPAVYWAALCTDGETCAKRWHPYLASADAHPTGNWSIVEVPVVMFIDRTGLTYPPGVPRVKAWAYRGQPVYTYYQDEHPADIWGEMVRWTGNTSFMSAVRVPGHPVSGG
jgi:predicted lipoprotein with Yx(FWY)xxD motif